MKIREKIWSHTIPIPIHEAWSFFTTPENLSKITPVEMNFKIINKMLDPELYPGMIIRYTVSPMWNMPIKWVTEITQVKAPNYFVDEQRFGPYRFWHHQHHFKAKGSSTIMTDILHYVVPFGLLGSFVDKWMIDSKIEHIFAYRKEVILNLFT